uniref:Globin n=1 Tax=Polypedilum nubifer TaxID=54969 RepID=V5YLS5_9DIPT|nr:globin [Polypedilum nubifer]
MVATPALPTFTDAQVATIKGDWNNIKGQGVEILYHFLNKFPGNYPMFKQFGGKDLNAAKGTPEFSAQATAIINLLNGVMDKLGSDNAGAQAILANLGKTHKAKGITKEQFQQFREATTELLGNLGLGGNLGAWNALFDFVLNVVFTALDS